MTNESILEYYTKNTDWATPIPLNTMGEPGAPEVTAPLVEPIWLLFLQIRKYTFYCRTPMYLQTVLPIQSM